MISLGCEKAHEMHKGAFPDTKLKLVHQVRGEYLITVEGGVYASESSREGVLKIYG